MMGVEEVVAFQDDCLEMVLDEFHLNKQDAFISLLFTNILLLESLPGIMDETLDTLSKRIAPFTTLEATEVDRIFCSVPPLTARRVHDVISSRLPREASIDLGAVFSFLARFKTVVLELENRGGVNV